MAFLGCSITLGSAVMYSVYVMEPEVILGEKIETPVTQDDVQTPEIDSDKQIVHALEVVVAVQGVVRNPEAYRFAEGGRVNDVLESEGE